MSECNSCTSIVNSATVVQINKSSSKLIFDFEVFKNDWVFGYLPIVNDTLPEECQWIVNNSDELKQFITEHMNDVWIGYNSSNYDKWILSAILNGRNDIYEISTQLVNGIPGWKLDINLYSNLINYDCMHIHKSLKELEGHLGVNIHECEIDFNINRKLTHDELIIVQNYNKDDLINTKLVFEESLSDFDAKFDILNLLNLPLSYMDRTLPTCIAIALNPNKNADVYNDDFDLSIPDCINLGKYKDLLSWHKDHPNYKKNITVDTKSMDCDLGWGGIHGAIKNKKYKGRLINADVSSLYPSLMVKYGYYSRNMLNKDIFKHAYDENLRLKKLHDPKRGAYKLICNSTYGTFKAEHNRLFDPKSANNIVVAGQLMLLDLIDKLESAEIKIYQANTDGVIFEDTGDWESILNDWQQRTGLTLEINNLTELYQKDVNNYIAVFKDGTTKGKGRFFGDKSKLDNDLPIINKAITEELLNDIPVADTINNCNNLIEFQHIVKCSSKYDCFSHNGKSLKDKTIRVFASTNEKDSSLYKVKMNGSREKISYTAEHCFIDNSNITNKTVPEHLDKQYYINLANDILKDLNSKIATVGTKLNDFENNTNTLVKEDTALKINIEPSESISVDESVVKDDIKTIPQIQTPSNEYNIETSSDNNPPTDIETAFTEEPVSIGLSYNPKDMLKNIPETIANESHFGLMIVHNFDPITNKGNKKPVFIKRVSDDQYILHEGKGEFFNKSLNEISRSIGDIVGFDKLYSGGNKSNEYNPDKLQFTEIKQPAYLIPGWYFGKGESNTNLIVIDIDLPNEKTIDFVKSNCIPYGYTEYSCSGAYHIMCITPENIAELNPNNDGKLNFTINNGSEIEIFFHSYQIVITGNIVEPNLTEPIPADKTYDIIKQLLELKDIKSPIYEEKNNPKETFKQYEYAPKCYEILIPLQDDNITLVTTFNSKDVDGNPAMKGKHPIEGGTTPGGNLTVGKNSWYYWHGSQMYGGILSAIAIANNIIKCSKIKFNPGEPHNLDHKLTKKHYKEIYKIIEAKYPEFYKELEECKKPKYIINPEKIELIDDEKAIAEQVIYGEWSYIEDINNKVHNKWTYIDDDNIKDNKPRNKSNFIDYILWSCEHEHAGDKHIVTFLTLMHACHKVINSDGIHIQIQAETGTGKSHGVKTWYKRLPNEDGFKGHWSPKSLFNNREIHEQMTFVMDDDHQDETSQDIIKQSTTDFKSDIEQLVSVSVERKIKQTMPGRQCWVTINADLIGDEQLLSRVILLHSDCDENQINAIRKKQASKHDLQNNKYALNDSSIRIIKHIWQNLIPKAYVTIPFGNNIKCKNIHDTRSVDIFFELIKSHCILNFKHRAHCTITDEDGNEQIAYIAVKEDFDCIKTIYNELMKNKGGSQQNKYSKTSLKIVDYIKKCINNKQFNIINGYIYLKKSDIISAVGISDTTYDRTLKGRADRSEQKALLDSCMGITTANINTQLQGAIDANNSTNEPGLKINCETFKQATAESYFYWEDDNH